MLPAALGRCGVSPEKAEAPSRLIRLNPGRPSRTLPSTHSHRTLPPNPDRMRSTSARVDPLRSHSPTSMGRKTERSAPLVRIQDAQLHRSPLTGGRVVLSTAGGSLGIENIAYLRRADALAFADALTPLLGGHQEVRAGLN